MRVLMPAHIRHTVCRLLLAASSARYVLQTGGPVGDRKQLLHSRPFGCLYEVSRSFSVFRGSVGRSSSVGMVTHCGLGDRGAIPGRRMRSLQNGSGSHPVSYPMGLFPRE